MKHITRKEVSLFVALILLMSTAALAQKEVGISDTVLSNVMKAKGRIIAEGKNSQPVGQFNLKTYRVEEVSLQKSVAIEMRGRLVNVDRAWRITVTGGPFPVRALPAVIWIGDVPLGSGVENEQLSEISVLLFDRSLLREGSAISLSYGESKINREELPEKLRLAGTK